MLSCDKRYLQFSIKMENIVMDIFLSSNRDLDSSEDSSSGEDEALFLEMLGTFERQRRVKIQGFVENIIPQLMDDGFQGHFRLTREHVELFLQELEIPVPPTQRPGRSRRPPLNRLLLTLWFLANRECYRSTAERFNVTVSTAHYDINEMLMIIYEQSHKWIRWPTGDEEAIRSIQGFENQQRQWTLPGVFGAVDGTHVPILQPKGSNAYVNRKSSHSLHIQAICDSNLVFLDVYCGWPGSAHDARVWRNSPIAEELLSDPYKIPRGSFIVGDSAYPLRVRTIVPFRDNGHLTPAQRRFNKALSGHRVAIEHAFGRLKNSFRKLKGLEITALENFKHIVFAACCLHNFRIGLGYDLMEDDPIDNVPEGMRDEIEVENNEIREILKAPKVAVAYRNSLVATVV